MTTTRTKKVATHVRWMVRRDIPAIIAVDRANGVETTDVEVEYHLQRRDTIGMVAEVDDEVVGHMVYRLERDAVVLVALRVKPGRFGVYPLVEKLLYKQSVSHQRPILAVPVAAECRTDTVRGLCLHGAPPAILADALQDADCRDGWLLDALRRDDGTAVRLALAVAHGLNRQPV